MTKCCIFPVSSRKKHRNIKPLLKKFKKLFTICRYRVLNRVGGMIYIKSPVFPIMKYLLSIKING
jgi:hypothetical protein